MTGVGPMGMGTVTTSGAIDVSNSPTIAATFSQLQPGTGYQLTLHATSVEGNATCVGAATFNVAARTTTPVTIHLYCQQLTTNGGANVQGLLNSCPLIDSLGASPGEALVGGTMALTAVAHDLDHAPAPLTYHWASSSGTLSDAAAQIPQFTCTTSGPATITLTVSDGDVTSGCPDVQSLSVFCTASPL